MFGQLSTVISHKETLTGGATTTTTRLTKTKSILLGNIRIGIWTIDPHPSIILHYSL